MLAATVLLPALQLAQLVCLPACRAAARSAACDVLRVGRAQVVDPVQVRWLELAELRLAQAPQRDVHRAGPEQVSVRQPEASPAVHSARSRGRVEA